MTSPQSEHGYVCFTNASSHLSPVVMVRVALLLLAGCLLSVPSWAQSGPLPPNVSSYAPAAQAPAPGWEARIGGGVANPGGREGGLLNIGGELLTPRIVPLSDRFAAAFIPRFNIGSSINLNGTRYAYAGATWTFDIGRDIFVEASLAAALHDGQTGAIIPVNRLSLGCDTGTREAARSASASLTVGASSPRWSISARPAAPASPERPLRAAPRISAPSSATPSDGRISG